MGASTHQNHLLTRGAFVMAIRTIRDNESTESIWEELVFTEARLLGDEHAKELAPTISALLARVEQLHGGQLGLRREVATAQAQVDAMDDQLDDWVRALDTALLTVVGQNTQSPRYRRYFPAKPSNIIRLGLESELGRVRSWAGSLATEPEPALQQLGAELSKLVVAGDAALERRRQAATARSDHRVRSITTLIDDINGARLSLYGQLILKATELHLPPDWPNRFFRRTTRTPKVQLPAPVPGPAPAPAPGTSG